MPNRYLLISPSYSFAYFFEPENVKRITSFTSEEKIFISIVHENDSSFYFCVNDEPQVFEQVIELLEIHSDISVIQLPEAPPNQTSVAYCFDYRIGDSYYELAFPDKENLEKAISLLKSCKYLSVAPVTKSRFVLYCTLEPYWKGKKDLVELVKSILGEPS